MTSPMDAASQEQNPEGQRPEAGTSDPLASSATGAAAVDPIQKLEQELASVQAKANEHYDQLLRAQAEMENVRRRAHEEAAKARKFGIESFAEGLVPVKDSLEAALAQAGQSAEDMKTGIETTLKQLSAAFERNHLSEINPAPGEKFDPHQHQAIATVQSEHPSNTVVAVLQKGYMISDRVLRPALVTVAS